MDGWIVGQTIHMHQWFTHMLTEVTKIKQYARFESKAKGYFYNTQFWCQNESLPRSFPDWMFYFLATIVYIDDHLYFFLFSSPNTFTTNITATSAVILLQDYIGLITIPCSLSTACPSKWFRSHNRHYFLFDVLYTGYMLFIPQSTLLCMLNHSDSAKIVHVHVHLAGMS